MATEQPNSYALAAELSAASSSSQHHHIITITPGGDMTTKENDEGLQQLRRLISEKMIERGGGLLQESLHSAADEIGCSHVSLRKFLHGGGISVEMAIKLAIFLGREPGPPTAEVVRLAGYADIADFLEKDTGKRKPRRS